MDCDMTLRPEITVLIPVYNGEKYLEQALESVLNQTFKDFEVLVIDDGSTDDSIRILKRFAIIDDRVRVLQKENTGLIDTLNFGLAESVGNWIARMDQDDIAFPRRLELQHEKVESDSSLVLVGGNFETVIEANQRTRTYRLPHLHSQLVDRLYRVQGFFPHSSAMFNAETARQIGGYEPQALYNEDWDLWLRMSAQGKIGLVSETIISIRKHSLQMTANSGSYVPQEEAYISSTVHLIQRHLSDDHTIINMDRQALAALVRETERFRRFSKVVAMQRYIGSKTSRKNQLIIIFRTLFRIDTLAYLIFYRLLGTNGPILTVKQLVK
jgi:glycosyltransferase involved in cell wall biosynthesis